MAQFAEAPTPRSPRRPGPAHRPAPPPPRVPSAVAARRLPVVLPLAAGGSLPGVALRHSLGVAFWRAVAADSISLHPFARPALPGFGATMGALTPAGRWGHRPGYPQGSLLTRPKRPTIPPSTTPGRPGVPVWFCRPGLPRAGAPRALHPRCWVAASLGLRHSLAGSPRPQAESGSSSCGLVVHLPLLSTPPRGDAVTFGYEVQTQPRQGLAPCCFVTITGARVRRGIAAFAFLFRRGPQPAP
jgi:hypothetical protein